MFPVHQSKCLQFFLFIEAIIFISCGILFLLLMKDVWEKFQSKMMTTNSRWRNDQVEEKLAPWITICPLQSYKTLGNHYTTEAYLNNVYTFDEIIERSLSQLHQTFSYFNFNVSGTAIYGNCFTFSPKKKIKAMEKARFYLRRNTDIKVLTS